MTASKRFSWYLGILLHPVLSLSCSWVGGGREDRGYGRGLELRTSYLPTENRASHKPGKPCITGLHLQSPWELILGKEHTIHVFPSHQ